MPRAKKRGSRGRGGGRGRPAGSAVSLEKFCGENSFLHFILISHFYEGVGKTINYVLNKIAFHMLDKVYPFTNTQAASKRIDHVLHNIKTEPQPSTSSMFGTDDVIYGSSFDVFQEVIVEEEIQDINVENSLSNSPISLTNESNSNENSVSSFTASETHNKYWTREDLTPSDVLPDNLFTENEEDIKSFSMDPNNMDTSINLNNDTGFSLNNLFPIKEEPMDVEALKISETGIAEVKKVTRRKIKQEPTDTASQSRYKRHLSYLVLTLFICYSYRRLKMMSLYEEKTLFRQLRPLAEKNVLSPEIRRLYRKLSWRSTKRSIGEEPFNFDQLVAKLTGREWSCPISSNEPSNQFVGVSNVLDRFQKGCLNSSTSQTRLNISFRMRLFGTSEDQFPQPFVSPYTGR